MKHKLLLLYSWLIRTTLFFLPDAPIFMRLRGKMYSYGMKECGRNFQVAHNAILNTLETISVGRDVYIAYSCVLLGGGEIELGDEVVIGPGVVIASGNRTRKFNSFRFGNSRAGTIQLEKGSWVGSNCTIVPGAILPKGSILAANSVLNRKFTTPNSLYAGVPAVLKEVQS